MLMYLDIVGRLSVRTGRRFYYAHATVGYLQRSCMRAAQRVGG